jgi:acyl-CoA thioesterase
MSYIERIRDRGRDANPFFCLMGIDVVSLDKGKATLSMRVRDDMLNGEGFLQGGMFTALADEAMVLAIYSLLEEDQVIATISESTSFMRGAGPGMVLVAEGRVIKIGRRVAFSEADVRLEGNVDSIARMSASFAISTIGKRPDPGTT